MIYLIATLVFIPLWLIGILFNPNPEAFVFLIMLMLYPIIGFIGGIIGAVIYNLAAKWVGGIEFTLETIDTQ